MRLFCTDFRVIFANSNNWESLVRKLYYLFLSVHSSIYFKNKQTKLFLKLLPCLDSMCMNSTGMTYRPCFHSGYSLPVDRRTLPTVIQPHTLQAYSEDYQAHLGKKRQLANWLSENDQISRNDPSDVIKISLKEQMSHVAIAGQHFHAL